MIQLIIVVLVIFWFIGKVFLELWLFEAFAKQYPGFKNLSSALKWLNIATLIICGGMAWHTMEMRDLHNLQHAEIETIKSLIKPVSE